MSTKDPKDKQGSSHSEMTDQQQIEKIVAALFPKVVDLQRKLIQELERIQSLKFEELQLEIQAIKDDQKVIQDIQKTIQDDQKTIQNNHKVMETSIQKLQTELDELYKQRGK